MEIPMPRFVPIAALLCLAVGSAHAEPPRLYFQLQGGPSFGHDDDVSDRRGPTNGKIRYEHGSFDDPGDLGWNGGGAVGLHFRHGEKHSFRAEVTGGYDRVEIKKLVVEGQDRSHGGHLGVGSAFASGFYEHDFGNLAIFKAFIGGGLGVGFVDFQNPSSSSQVFIDDGATELAWHITTGVVLPIADHIDLTAAYRYLGTTEAELDASARDVDTGIVSRYGKVDAEVGVHGAQLGIRITF
jgi:opacity protein-like surface antigen